MMTNFHLMRKKSSSHKVTFALSLHSVGLLVDHLLVPMKRSEIFFPQGHFRTFFTFSGSFGGSFARAHEAFRNFSFYTNFGQAHSFHAQSESESESDRDPHH